MSDEIIKIAIFQKREVRKQLHGGEWWFVINDVIAALTDSSDPAQYLKRLRSRDTELALLFDNPVDKGGVQIVPPLALPFDTPGGKQKLSSWNTEGIFRLIQSVPSKKAEPFKRWLARTGYERVQEIENPELAQERGIEGGREFAILTAEISKATFGVTPSQYKKLKGLKRENLRDHMNDLELLFTQLGEAATTEIARTDNVQGMDKNLDAAQRGGSVAGTARKQLEGETGKKVINSDNNIPKNDTNTLT